MRWRSLREKQKAVPTASTGTGPGTGTLVNEPPTAERVSGLETKLYWKDCEIVCDIRFGLKETGAPAPPKLTAGATNPGAVREVKKSPPPRVEPVRLD